MPLDEIAAQGALDQNAANDAAKFAYDQDYYRALLEAGQEALRRSRSAAEFVQKSAAAIGTLYATVLGVSFSIANRPLPIRGLLPALFLGLAIVLSTVYVAYVTRPGMVTAQVLPPSPPERMLGRLETFFRFIGETVHRRSYWLRASVLALGIGVVLLPAPFIAFDKASRINEQTINADYPWPTPPTPARARPSSLEAIVFQAQVAEITSERQRALLQETDTYAIGTVLVAIAGLILVFTIPRIAPAKESGNPSTAGVAAQ